MGGSLMPESYTVQQGDCIHSIAFAKGFFPDTLWNHADNKSLKDRRKDPHVLLAGDTVSIPDKRLKEVSKPHEQRHRFRRKGVPKEMRVQLLEGDQPVKNALCKVKVDGSESEITSDGDGWLKIPIPPNAAKAIIQLPSGREFELVLGNLDPVDQVSGVQGRLHALGYYEGPIDGQLSRETKDALKAFKAARGIPVSSAIDDQTRNALVEATGS
jgi:N-acetylmuramoyl-L-alanine amidase